MASNSPKRQSLDPPVGRSAERLHDMHQRSGSLNNSKIGYIKTMGETSNSSLYAISTTAEKRSPKHKAVARGGYSPQLNRDSKLEGRASSTVGNSPTK